MHDVHMIPTAIFMTQCDNMYGTSQHVLWMTYSVGVHTEQIQFFSISVQQLSTNIVMHTHTQILLSLLASSFFSQGGRTLESDKYCTIPIVNSYSTVWPNVHLSLVTRLSHDKKNLPLADTSVPYDMFGEWIFVSWDYGTLMSLPSIN